MNPWLVARAGMARHFWTYALFFALIALATAIGVAVSAQEAALDRLLAEQIEQRRFDRGDGVDRGAQIEGLQPAAAAVAVGELPLDL